MDRAPDSPYLGYEAAYHGMAPPWDIGRPQPALLAVAQAGGLIGPVLDAGCGTGEHALMAAALGFEATGIDASPSAIAIAERKATDRGLEARFVVGDALELDELGRTFGSVIDSGLFHGFSRPERIRFAEGLAAVLEPGGRYYMLAFSDREPGIGGPFRLTEAEIREPFADGWTVDSIEPSRIETTIPGRVIEAWLTTISRR
jgi:SAM-dependent methyltransferase